MYIDNTPFFDASPSSFLPGLWQLHVLVCVLAENLRDGHSIFTSTRANDKLQSTE